MKLQLGQAEGTEAAQLDVERIQRELAAEMPELAQAAQLAREQPGNGEATPDVVRQVCRAGKEAWEYCCRGILAASGGWRQTCLSWREAYRFCRSSPEKARPPQMCSDRCVVLGRSFVITHVRGY